MTKSEIVPPSQSALSPHLTLAMPLQNSHHMDEKTKTMRTDVTCLRAFRSKHGRGRQAFLPGLSDSHSSSPSSAYFVATLPVSTQQYISVLCPALIIEIPLIIVTIAVCNCSSKA
jgi:hypothetical protein